MVSPWMENGDACSYLLARVHSHGIVEYLRIVHLIVRFFTSVSSFRTASLNLFPPQLYQVAKALQYLHSRGIVHGDVRGVSHFANSCWILLTFITRRTS